MLDDLPGDDNIEVLVRVRKPIALGIEVIYKAGEFAIGKLRSFPIRLPWPTVVCAANLLVPA